jgi:CubicO group peptidase (beta-lactamase class C family)
VRTGERVRSLDLRRVSRRAWTRIAVVVAVLVASSQVLLRPSAPPALVNGEPDYAAIDDFMRGEVTDSRVPGMSLAIVHNGAVTHLAGYGTSVR